MTKTNSVLPLCVDLDGSLLKTDVLQEAIILSVKKKPWILFLLPFWFLKGISYVKYRTAEIGLPNISLLPVNENVLEFIKTEKKKGRKIVLATAAIDIAAEKVAEHFGIFDEVFATTKEHNLRRDNKRKALVQKYGEKGYDYIGDSTSDIPVWESANSAIMVNPSNGLKQNVKNVSKEFFSEINKLKIVIKQIRLYQWVKNLLIFLPLILAHEFVHINLWYNLTIGFICFGFIASAIYIINDLLDIESDRKHPRKKERPLAAGLLSMKSGVQLSLLLLATGIFLSIFFLNLYFNVTLLFYILLTTLYSMYFKSIFAVDIIILSILYSLRLLAGTFIAEVEASQWLIAFSMFVFLSLAMLKRYTELDVVENSGGTTIKARGYMVDDKQLIMALGSGCGLVSILVLIFYINSPEVITLYTKPYILYSIVPLYLLWIMRIWFKAVRGIMHDDPIVFTIKDKKSYLIGFIITIIIFASML